MIGSKKSLDRFVSCLVLEKKNMDSSMCDLESAKVKLFRNFFLKSSMSDLQNAAFKLSRKKSCVYL